MRVQSTNISITLDQPTFGASIKFRWIACWVSVALSIPSSVHKQGTEEGNATETAVYSSSEFYLCSERWLFSCYL